MQRSKLIPMFFIQLFAEGGGDGGTGAGDAGGAPAGAESAELAQPQKGAKSNPLASVRYGKEEGSSDAGVATQVPDRNAQFEALIKGEYKDLYDQRVQDTIQKRLKSTAETVNRYNELSPVLELLAGKYGVDANDVKALSKAIEDDSTFYEDEALERGITVEQLKQIRKMERENAQLKAERQQAETQKQADALYSSWLQQAEQVQQVYPSFDLPTELQNEQFRALLRSNVPIQTAFEVIHKDEILPAAMQYTAKQITQKVTNNIRAGQNRPTEGAMGNRSSVVVKSDVSQLTRADREEIDRRVARGERIVF